MNSRIEKARLNAYTRRFGNEEKAKEYMKKMNAEVAAKRGVERFQNVVYNFKVLQRGRNPTVNTIIEQITKERPDELEKVKSALLREAKVSGKTNEEAASAANSKLRNSVQFELNRVGMGGGKRRKTHRRKSHKRSTRKRSTRKHRSTHKRRH